MRYYETKIFFDSRDGLKLCGVYNRPDQETDACVVLCHGIGIEKDEGGLYTAIGRELCRQGVAAFRFDFRAHGASEGRGRELSITAEVTDLASAVDYLRSLGYRRFGLVATSFGGVPATLYAADEQKSIVGLAYLNALIDIRHLLTMPLPFGFATIRKRALAEAERGGYLRVPKWHFTMGPKTLEEVKTLPVLEKFKSLHRPMLFIHGDRDRQIPLDHSREYAKILTGARLEILAGATHGLRATAAQRERVIALVSQFFLPLFHVPHPG